MMPKNLLQLTMALAMCVKMSNGQSSAYVCKHTNVAGSEFELVFKYTSDGNATGLSSFEVSTLPRSFTAAGGSACNTHTLDGDVFTLQYSVDVDAAVLACGMFREKPKYILDMANTRFSNEQGHTSRIQTPGARFIKVLTTNVIDLMSPSLYRFAILAEGTSTYYTSACNISDLQLPNEETVESFATGHLVNIAEFNMSKPPVAKLEVLTPDGRPISTATVGDDVKLRFTHEILKEDPIIHVPTNFGTLFYTAFPSETNFLLIKIYTLSESLVNVQVNVSFNGSTDGVLVNTTKSAPAILPVTLVNYKPVASTSRWVIVDYGLKVQSQGEDIGVVLEQPGITYFVVHPVDVLGKEYLRFQTEADEPRVLIIATEDNTSVTFDLLDYRERVPTLEIAGTNFSSAAEATVVINEFEVLELVCNGLCRRLAVKSDKKVAVLLLNYPLVLQIPETNKLYRNFIIPKSVSASSETVVYIVSADRSVDVEFTQENSTEVLDGIDEGSAGATYDLGTHLRSSGPILAVYITSYPDKAYLLSMVLLGTIQWSTRHYFYLETSKKYDIIVTATESHLNSLAVITPDNDIQLDELNTTRTSVIYTDIGVTYADLSMSIELNVTGWYEFYSKDPTAQFGIYIIDLENEPIVILPFGMKFPCVDNSTGDIVSCESSDSSPTEDNPNVLKLRFKADTLLISNTSTFIGSSAQTLHRKGCNTNEEGSAFSTVSPFQRQNSDPDKWVMETNAFRIFRFAGSYYVFFRLKFGACIDENGGCEVSCAIRNKRSTESHHVDFRLKVSDGVDDDGTQNKRNKQDKRKSTCESTIIYWVPHMLLVLIIIVEVVATSYFLMKKWKLKQS